MQDATKIRRKLKDETLSNLRRTARQNIYTLRQLRFNVNIIDNLPDAYKWRELTYTELYAAEQFTISCGDKCLIYAGSFFTLRKFVKMAKRYRRLYGVKSLCHHLNELLSEFISQYQEEQDNIPAYRQKEIFNDDQLEN